MFASFCVSTGCLSYGICMAYTSSAIPSMMEPSSAIKISQDQLSWMSKWFSCKTIDIYRDWIWKDHCDAIFYLWTLNACLWYKPCIEHHNWKYSHHNKPSHNVWNHPHMLSTYWIVKTVEEGGATNMLSLLLYCIIWLWNEIIFHLYVSGSLLCIGVLFGSVSAVFLMDAVGRKASLLAFSVMSLFIGWTLLMAASQVNLFLNYLQLYKVKLTKKYY